MIPRVLFVLKHRNAPYGDGYGWGGESGDRVLSSGLFNSARFVAEMLVEAGIPTKLVHVRDGNDIHRELVAFKATVVVIEAFWCPPYKFDDLARAAPHVRFIVRNHSATPFLSQEGLAFEWSFEYLKRPNVAVAPNDKRMLREMRFFAATRHPHWDRGEIDRRVPYLPNFYPLDLHTAEHHDGVVLDIGCFGAIRPLKNQGGQAIAALMFADHIRRPLRFHINAGRTEGGGLSVLRSLTAIFDGQPRAELVSDPWLPHDEFRALIASMDLVTQVSFSETFCIVAADAASQGVPLITSPEVPWGAAMYQANPTSVEDMVRAMHEAWALRFENRLINPNRVGLRRYVAKSRELWLDYLANT